MTGRVIGKGVKRARAAIRNRRKKRRVMKRVGERIGSSNARVENLEQTFNLGTKTLHQVPLLDLIKSTSFNDATDARLRDVVNMRGIKFCIHMRNTINTNRRLHGHVAIVSCKNEPDDGIIPTQKFFRSQGENNTRAQDFNTFQLTGLDVRCLPINTDLYNVHKHKRFSLAPSTSTEGRDERMQEFWMPIRRQLRYQNNSQKPEGKNMYMLMWFSDVEETSGAPAGNPIPDAVKVDYRLTKWFRQTVGF